LLVLNKEDLTLMTVDPQTLKVTGKYPAGPNPHEVIASADGKTAYISNYDAEAANAILSVMDVPGKRMLAPVELGALRRPHGLALFDGKVYFTAEGAKVIGRYDPAAWKVDWVLGTGQDRTHMITIGADGKRLMTTNVSSASVSIIEWGEIVSNPALGRRFDWKVTTVPVGRGPEGNDLSPDGKELWVLNGYDGSVSIIDPAAKAVLETIAVPVKAGNRLKFTPNGKLVFVSDNGGPLVIVLDAATRKIVKQIDVGVEPAAAKVTGMLMEPNGARAFVAVESHKFIAVIDLKTLTIIGRIDVGTRPDGMAWAIAN
jgi:YVTN family beta-propeller protein